MSWIDDIQTKVDQLNAAVPKDIKDAFNKVAKDEFVKLGNKALGNLTAADIARGEKGDNSNAAITNNSGNAASLNANQTSQVMGMSQQLMGYLPLILGGGVLAYFLLKKRRG